MSTINLKNEAQRNKYGIVRVYNLDRSIDREFKITNQELEKFLSDPQALPPGISKEDWYANLATVHSRSMDVGDMQKQFDGSLIIKYDERVINNQFVESKIYLNEKDWNGDVGSVTVKSQDLIQINTTTDKENIQLSSRGGKKIATIINGELEYAP